VTTNATIRAKRVDGAARRVKALRRSHRLAQRLTFKVEAQNEALYHARLSLLKQVEGLKQIASQETQ